MTIASNIPLMGQTPDFSQIPQNILQAAQGVQNYRQQQAEAPARQAILQNQVDQIPLQRQQAQGAIDLQNQQIQSIKDTDGFKSVVFGALQGKQLLDAGDTQGFLQLADDRAKNITARGGQVDATAQIADLVRNGRIDEAKQRLDSGIAMGKQAGILKPDENSHNSSAFNDAEAILNAQGITAKSPGYAQKLQSTMASMQPGADPNKGWEITKDAMGNPVRINARTGEGMPRPGGTNSLSQSSGGLTGGEFLKTINSTEAAQVKALAEGRMQFPAGAALRSPYWQGMLSAVSHYDPNFDAVNYNARSKTRADFVSGKNAQNIKSLNTAIGHLGTLDEQIGGTASHDFTPLNYVQNKSAELTGSSGPTKFKQTASALATELTQVFRGSGGAEADVKRYLDELSVNGSREQKKEAVKNIVDLLHSRISAIGDQYNQGMGTTADPLTLLNPKAASVLQRINGDPSNAAPTLSADDQAAINWANANPNDPRAAQIKQLHGGQ